MWSTKHLLDRGLHRPHISSLLSSPLPSCERDSCLHRSFCPPQSLLHRVTKQCLWYGGTYCFLYWFDGIDAWQWPTCTCCMPCYMTTLTRTLGHADGAVLVLCTWVGLQFEGVLAVDHRLRTLRHTGARVVEVPASLGTSNQNLS